MSNLWCSVCSYLVELWLSLTRGWDRFWFTPAHPATLGVLRIGTGLVMLYVYLSCTPYLLSFVGPDAWIDGQAMQQIREYSPGGASEFEEVVNRYWAQSVWFYVQDPMWVWASHVLFLIAIVCFTLGLFSRPAAVLVWLGHISFIQRSHVMWFGVDSILAMLIFYLMFGPTGGALSLDRMLWRRRQAPPMDGFAPAPVSPRLSWSANVVVRLIQIHMCIIYLCSGLAKLQGGSWWGGTAVLFVTLNYELAPFSMTWLGDFDNWQLDTMSNLLVWFTLFFEISFIFLIWHRLWRPLMLLTAVLLHVGIGVFMGLDAFGAVMLVGCLSFVHVDRLFAAHPRPALDVARPLSQVELLGSKVVVSAAAGD